MKMESHFPGIAFPFSWLFINDAFVATTSAAAFPKNVQGGQVFNVFLTCVGRFYWFASWANGKRK